MFPAEKEKEKNLDLSFRRGVYIAPSHIFSFKAVLRASLSYKDSLFGYEEKPANSLRVPIICPYTALHRKDKRPVRNGFWSRSCHQMQQPYRFLSLSLKWPLNKGYTWIHKGLLTMDRNALTKALQKNRWEAVIRCIPLFPYMFPYCSLSFLLNSLKDRIGNPGKGLWSRSCHKMQQPYIFP